MKKFKISKAWGIFLSLAIVLASTIQISSALEDPNTFDIDSAVVYGEDGSDATITLDLEKLDSKYTVEEVKDPLGNTMDLTNLSYDVTENGTYNFEVNYVEVSTITNENGEVVVEVDESGTPMVSELRTYTKEVEVTDIKQPEEANKEATAKPAALTRSSKNTIVNITDFRLINPDGTSASETNHLTTPMKLEIDWEISTENGEVFSEGDVIEFSVLLTDSNFNTLSYSVTSNDNEIRDSNNKNLGTWGLTGSKTLKMVLNKNAEGSVKIKGQFKTGAVISLHTLVDDGRVSTVTVGNCNKKIKWPVVERLPIGNSISGMGVAQVSDSKIVWRWDVGSSLLYEMGESNKATPLKNVLIEHKILDPNAEVTGLNIYGTIRHPATIDMNKASRQNLSNYSFIHKFKELTPTAGETYGNFKTRINNTSQTYGFYKNVDGTTMVLVNLGDMPNPNLTYSEYPENKSVFEYFQNTLGKDIIPDNTKSYFDKFYGSNGVTKGAAAQMIVDVHTTHNKTLTTEIKTSDGTLTYNSGETRNHTNVTGTLIGMLANASLGPAKSVQLYKVDKTSNEFLSGASFKLQRQNGGNWSDYTAGDGGALVRSTDDTGRVMFSNLAAGTYKFVEVTSATGYNKDTVEYDNPTFTVTDGESEGRLIIAKNEKLPMSASANVITKYVGDTLTVPEGVTAKDHKGNAITVNGSNTVSKHAIPSAGGKYSTPGTYEITHTVTDPTTGQSANVKQTVKVNGLPTITATPQVYEITDSGINAKVQANPKAKYDVASNTVGAATVSTGITNDKLKYEIVAGPDKTGFNKIGIYDVKYTATNPDNKQVSTTTQVLITSPTVVVENGVYIDASDFVAGTYKEAALLTVDTAKDGNHAKAYAYADKYDGSNNHIGFEVIPVASIAVSGDELDAIKASDANGGEYPLTFVAEKNGKSASTTVNVKVQPTTMDNWDGTLGLGATGFTVNQEDASKLTEAKAKKNSNVDAVKQEVDPYGHKTVTNVTSAVKADAAQLEAIKNAPVTGGIYNLTYTVTTPINGVDKTKNKTVVVTVLPKDAITKDDLSIGANGFILENAEAKDLTVDNAKNADRGNSSAYYVIKDKEGFIVDSKNVSGQVVVSADQVKVINKTTRLGGIYPLNYSVTENGITVSKTVLVLVRPEFGPTPVDEFNLPIAAEGFAIAYPEAKPLTDDQAKDHANATAYYGKLNEVGKVIDAKDVSHNIAANQQHMSMIQNTPITGGTHNLQFTISEEGLNSTVTVPVLVRPKYDVIDKEEDPNISLGAFNFELENDEAATLDVKDAVLPYRGNAVAYKIIYNDKNEISSFVSITDKITVNKDEIKVINKAPREGGVYPLTYYVEDDGIQVQKTVQVLVKPVTAEGEKDLPLAAWDFAVDYDELEAFDNAAALTNGNAMATYVVRDEDGVAVEYKDVSANITADSADMDTIKNAPVTGGIYDLTYTVTEGGLTSNKTVSVLVRPYKGEKDDEETLAIGAYDFVLDYEEAAPFTAADALLEKHGNPVAYISNYNEFGEIESHAIITDKVVANEANIKNINKAPRNGGIYDLTYSVTDKVMIDGKEVEQTVSKTVKVLVNPVGGVKDPDVNRQNVVIDGEGFTVSYYAAKELDSAKAIKNADGIAYGITYDAKGLIDEMKNISGDITVDEAQLKAINEAPVTGGIYDLTLYVTDGTNSASVTVPVLVEGLAAEHDDDRSISLTAFGFILENEEAQAFTDADALLEKYGNPAAYRTDYNKFGEVSKHTEITEKVVASKADVKKINNVSRNGGIFELTYMVTDTVKIDGKEVEVTVEKTVEVLVNPVGGVKDPDEEHQNVVIDGEGFTVSYEDAKKLDPATAIKNADGVAYGVTYDENGVISSMNDITGQITADEAQVKAINDAPITGGIYDLTLTVTDGENTASVTVPVLVEGLHAEHDEDGTISLTAFGFILENEEAQAFTDADALLATYGNPAAYRTDYNKFGEVTAHTVITEKVVASKADVKKINEVSRKGGVFELTYTVTDTVKLNGKEVEVTVEKTVEVLVNPVGGVKDPDDEHQNVVIDGEGFTVDYEEAKNLSPEDAIKNADGVAYGVTYDDNGAIIAIKDITGDITVDEDQLQAINDAPVTGGIYDLTLTVTDGENTASVTVPVLVEGLDANRDEDQTISLAAFGFILENKEALAFTDADALLEKHGNPAAYRTDYNEFGEVTAHTVITDKVKADSEDIKKINDAPREGGIYDLRYYVTDTVTIDGEQKEVTVEKTVQVLVKPIVSAGDKNVTISAEGFILENAEAQVLTDEESLVNGKVIAYGVTYTDYGTVASIKDISEDITVNHDHVANINATTAKGGIYDLAFSVSDGKNTATIEVPVLVRPLFYVNDEETGVIIGAEGFEIENKEAATLNDEASITKGNAVAYKVIKDADGYITGFEEISDKLVVDQAELGVIQKAPENGGIYDLTYYVTETITKDGEEVEVTVAKTIKVTVKGLNTPPMVETPDGDKLAISASDFTIENAEAATLNDKKAIDLAKAEAWLVTANTLVETTPTASMLDAIKKAPKEGGVYDLTFTAYVVNSDETITTNEVTIKVTVLPVKGNPSVAVTDPGNGTDTGDTTNVAMLLLLAFASLGVISRRRKIFNR